MSDEEEIEELVEEMVRKVEEFREPEENYPDEENVGEWPNQVGGASLNVLRKREAKTKGELEGVSVVALDIEIPNDFMVDPDGADLFADNVIRLIRQNAPPTGSGTIMKAGVLFESPEITDGVGLCFKEMSKITTEDIVNNLDNMSQSNRSPLELDVPRLLMQITYLHPPKGSGVKRYRLENLLNTIALEKRKRRRLEADEEDFEALHNNEEVVAEREGHDFIDIECDEGSDEESEDDEAVAQRPDKSGVVMRNNVSDDCLPHALYQALMYHEYKTSRPRRTVSNM
ncbi:hypothetical protein GCK72_015320 [Caenorhabditis remanei]|uniref:Uncharacterized protein n=1 Tax=Caenorhabditis remanei TaxID=31234 RepID=A0A6A5GTR7_CAERE|nr:hypothetical protein GCK72_015320 [Caenorhabditis remanei]KAF1758860.1 hypothetical protein GCK72_015320 [Caenorhabditis remanei]